MYQALYRKWRSKTFDELVGQDHVATTLKHQVAAGKLSHAYLFCGTRGTGKTSSAKILAKAANCPQSKDGNPCCACDICKGIESDSLLDVTEIDAASNSGVDNIRELREEAGFTPAVCKYRVYIIDETHMLSVGAFNALLKILEEPPEHVLFILATTEIHKVPATILSRCQRFDFRRIPSEMIAGWLGHVAGEEGVSLDGEAAALIAKLADGGMRDALSLLDLCMAAGKEITAASVEQSVGLVGQEHLFQMADALAGGDAGAAMRVLEGLWERSVDYQRLCEQMIGFYRNAMVVKAVPKPEELVPCLPGELERYREFVRDQAMEGILHSLEVLQDTLGRMSRTPQRRTELEMALLRLASPALSADNGALLTRIERLERSRGAVLRQSAAETPELSGAEPSHNKTQPDAAPATTPAGKADPPPAGESGGKTPLTPFAEWPQVLEVLKEKNRALYGTLEGSRAYEKDSLLLVDAGNDGMFSRMVRENAYTKESLRAAALEVTGRKYRLGPYNPEQYKVQEDQDQGPHLELDKLLKKASELGVDVEVK